MADGDRKPLVSLPPEEGLRRLLAMGQELDVDDSPIPIGLTDAEKKAARRPGLPAEEKKMETKPGFKTSEFWLSMVAKMLIAGIAYFNIAGGPLDQIATSVASSAPLMGLVVPLAKTALSGLLAYLAAKIAAKYTESRTEVKVAASGQGG